MSVLNLAHIIICTPALLYYLKPLEPSLQSVLYFPICKIGSAVLKCFVMCFEACRQKTEQTMLWIFWKTSWWPEQHICTFIGSESCCIALRLLCLCHLPKVLSTAGRIPNRCFLLLIFLFFLLHSSQVFLSNTLFDIFFLK